ncbi:MAG: 6,7-dimethyl-8-ribityllumazine synthase [Longimicrobiales bacterium]
MEEIRGGIDGAGRRFAIVVSRFNDGVTDRLLAGARACLAENGVQEDGVHVISVPGAWELPIAAKLAAGTGGYDAIIALGCVIRGETPHFDYVAGPAADGLARVALESAVPVTFGVLTTEDTAQALARAGGKLGNKGWDAALTALELADLARRLENGRARS